MRRRGTRWPIAGTVVAVLLAAQASRPPQPPPDPAPALAEEPAAAAAARGGPGAGPRPVARLPRARPRLPGGVRVIAEPEGFVAREDVLAGELALPDGRLVVDDLFLQRQISLRVPAGSHAVRVTLAGSVRRPTAGANVALATLVTGAGRPRRWRRVGIMSTDGGLGGFASAAAADRMAADADTGLVLQDRVLHAIAAAGPDHVARADIGAGLHVFTFATGLGDGGYGVYAGEDRRGRVVRVVLDAGLLHLAWPRGAPGA